MFSIAKAFATVHNLLSPSKAMAIRNGMETFAARLATFDSGRPAGTKRASNAKASKSAKWPHATPAPADVWLTLP